MLKLGLTGRVWNPSTRGGCGRKDWFTLEAGLGYTVNSSPTWATETQYENKMKKRGGRGKKGGRK